MMFSFLFLDKWYKSKVYLWEEKKYWMQLSDKGMATYNKYPRADNIA